MKCGDKEWMHCRVEKMGCKGCHYDKFNNLEIANEFANLTFIYGGKIAFTSEQMKRYQEAVRCLIEEREEILNEQAEVSVSASAHNRILELEKENKRLKEYEKYYQNERNLLDSYIPKERIKKGIEVLNKQIDEAIDKSKGGLDIDFIDKSSKLLAQKRILQSLLFVKEEEDEY